MTVRLPALLARSSAVALSASAATPAAAQQSDVVVMRRVISQGSYSRHHWDEGAWNTAPSCGEHAPSTRTVRCVERDTGRAVEDRMCSGVKPATSMEVADYHACQFKWTYDGWQDWLETCSDATSRSQTAHCIRYGAGSAEVLADDPASCGPLTEPLTDPAANYTGCSFDWRQADGACAGNGVRETVVTCRRSGGSSTATDVPSGCDVAKKPASTRSDNACVTTRYEWQVATATDWSYTCGVKPTRKVTYACTKLTAGVNMGPVADSFCAGQTMPDTTQYGPQAAACEPLPQSAPMIMTPAKRSYNPPFSIAANGTYRVMVNVGSCSLASLMFEFYAKRGNTVVSRHSVVQPCGASGGTFTFDGASLLAGDDGFIFLSISGETSTSASVTVSQVRLMNVGQ